MGSSYVITQKKGTSFDYKSKAVPYRYAVLVRFYHKLHNLAFVFMVKLLNIISIFDFKRNPVYYVLIVKVRN